VTARQWWAVLSPFAPRESHLFPVDPAGGGESLCGVRQGRCRRVEELAYPELWTRCSDCDLVAGGGS
jgi:hypothetical protein